MQEYHACNRVVYKVYDIIDETYHVQAVLGKGGFGDVYKVTCGKSTYALKLLRLWDVLASERSNLLKRFDREYEMGKIESEHLVKTIYRGMVAGNPYIVMEYCPGGDLFSAIKRDAIIDQTRIATQILLGIRDLHRNGKVHRDLKPENVLFRADGTAVISDFGIAGDRNNRLTQKGVTVGTLIYMPPEQTNPPKGREATVLNTTDIFSFGVMMYQVLTHLFPFGPVDSDEDIYKYLKKAQDGDWNRKLLLKVAPDWMPLIDGCLKTHITDRLQNADAALALLPEPYEEIRDDCYFDNQSVGIILRIMRGEELNKVIHLDDLRQEGKNVFTVGRKDEDVYNDVQITEEESCFLSRCHCTLEYDTSRERWLLRDGQARVDCAIAKRSRELFPCSQCTVWCSSSKQMEWKRSTNGTFIESTEVDDNGVYITPGNIISIGDVKIRVEGRYGT